MEGCPGFVEQADADLVYVQFVHTDFPHHVWLRRERVYRRQLRLR